MNTIYKSVLILSVGLISASVMAQKDSTLTRQVLLERDYNPTLNEATKINTAPNIFTPKTQLGSGTKFIEQAPQLNIGATRLGKVASGDIRTAIPFSKERFYLNFGAGSGGTIDGVMGVRALNTENDKLDISAAYGAMNGNINYAQPTELFKKAKAKYSDIRVNLNYQHRFEPSVLTLGGGYQNLGYNYYGTPFSPYATPNLIDLTTKQKVDVINFGAALKSSDKNEGLIKYNGQLSYTNFAARYGFFPSTGKKTTGSIIDTKIDLYSLLGDGKVGFVGGILNETHKGYANVGFSPYYKLSDIAWDVTLGFNVNFIHDEKDKFLISPNLLAQIHINEVNTLYASITGGVNNNTFTDILQENRYTDLSSKIQHSRTAFDIKGGFKSGIIPNLEFDLFAGYKQVKDDHLYAASSFLNASGTDISWGNTSTPIYAKVSTGHFGGALSTSLIPMTTLTAKVIGYFYSVKDQDPSLGQNNKAWGRPTFTAELTADVQPIDKLTLSLSYLLMSGRKGYSINAGSASADANGSSGVLPFLAVSEMKMKDVSELNIRAEYQIIKQVAIHARVNNLLDQKYEQQLGYTLQGINVIGGFNVKF